MQRVVKKRLVIGAMAVSVLAALAWAGYLSFRHVPTFYADALRQPAAPPNDAQHEHEMVRQMTALAGEAMRPGAWRTALDQRQINAYLANDLGTMNPHLLPANVQEPRVAIRADGLYIGWRSKSNWSTAIYSICLVPYVTKPNQLAVRISRIRAGAIPVPLGEVLDKLSAAAAKANIRLRWQQMDGDPVAIIDLPPEGFAGTRPTVLDSIELTAGSIILGGHTERSDGKEPTVRLSDHSAENENRQQ
ncbi:MAG: hypothetical protein K8T25_23330 [Planctomycetia bacterium]|nr:hypothetical protein [Planctomycetia bacterium]